jgi:ribosomal protein L5
VKGYGEKGEGNERGDQDACRRERYVPRLRKFYEERVVPELMKRFGYKNVMQVPRIQKVVINVGVGEGKDEARAIDSAVKELSLITGNAPSSVAPNGQSLAFGCARGNLSA